MGNDDLVKGAADKGCEGGRGVWQTEKIVVNLQVVTLLPDWVWGAQWRWSPRGIERDLADRLCGDVDEMTQNSALALLLLPPLQPLLQGPPTHTQSTWQCGLGSLHPGHTPASFSMRDPQSLLFIEPHGGLWGCFSAILHQLWGYRTRARGEGLAPRYCWEPGPPPSPGSSVPLVFSASS